MRILAPIKINAKGDTVTRIWNTMNFKNRLYLVFDVFDRTNNDDYILILLDESKIKDLTIAGQANLKMYDGELSTETALLERVE